MRPTDRIYVAGHGGLVGSALVRRLQRAGFDNLALRTRSELDLTDGPAVRAFIAAERPRHVFLAAARVGGILANSRYPADFIRDNLAIQLNVIDAAHAAGVPNLLFLGSSCIYPKHARQPMGEHELLTGPLEPTNEPYAIAKIAGLKLCEAFHAQYGVRYFTVMPTNLYGPGDNFDPETSHVLAALLRKCHDAKRTGSTSLEVWGTGTPLREFLHVDDLADACVFLMSQYDGAEIHNIGSGEEISIRALAELISEVVGFQGTLAFDGSKPDGTPRKLLDVSRLAALGWSARIPLREGIEETYRWFVSNTADAPEATGVGERRA